MVTTWLIKHVACKRFSVGHDENILYEVPYIKRKAYTEKYDKTKYKRIVIKETDVHISIKVKL